jgi:hypothetical protein
VTRRLAACDDPASRRKRFVALSWPRGVVLDFWAWDHTVNPEPFTTRQPLRTADGTPR